MPMLEELKRAIEQQEGGPRSPDTTLREVVEALHALQTKPVRRRDHGPMIKRVGDAICAAMENHGDMMSEALVKAINDIETQISVEAPVVNVAAPQVDVAVNVPEVPALTIDYIRDENDYATRAIVRPFVEGDDKPVRVDTRPNLQLE